MDAPLLAVHVYDRHSGGAPRTVICGVGRGEGRGAIGVVRLSARGSVTSVQRIETGLEPSAIVLRDLVGDDRDEVIVELKTYARNQARSVYRMQNERLRLIGETIGYWRLITFDLDGDGTHELLSTSCCANRSACAMGIAMTLMHFDGTAYQPAAARITDAEGLTMGEREATQWHLALPPLDQRPPGARYRIHAAGPFRKASVREGETVLATFDGDAPQRIATVTLPNPCHVLDVLADGPAGEEAWFLLEEIRD
jgi:hypothetical protein